MMFHATSCSEKAIADDFYNTHNHTLYACITKDPKHVTKKLNTYAMFTI